MKKALVTMVILLAAVAIALPASAFEVQYGGLFRVRLQSNDNVTGSQTNDNQNFIDQRLRIFFRFIASENLRLVTGFEMDTLWGASLSKVQKGHRDTINVELKHAYFDFMIPCTPIRAKVGLQPLSFMTGWILSEDFTAADLSAKFDPFSVRAGYVSEVNNNVTTWGDRVDDWYLAVGYAGGPFSAGIVGLYQDGHDSGTGSASISSAPRGENDRLFDLGVNLGYKLDWANFYFNYVQNLGNYDDVTTGDSIDYRGYMFDAGAKFFYGPFTFTVSGFYTSGDNDPDDSDYSGFVYPIGKSHYWSEIMGLGTLENTTGIPGQGDRVSPANTGAYAAADSPSNLWTINAGIAWQALDTTKLTFNYWYIGTANSVVSGTKTLADGTVTDTKSSSIGHELDFYIDQKVVDGLMLRIVGAYMFAEDAYTIYNDDDDPYEFGARLQWSF